MDKIEEDKLKQILSMNIPQWINVMFWLQVFQLAILSTLLLNLVLK